MHVLIIAEAGVNHNGSLETAKRMVDAAKACGVDIIKFQTAKPEALVSKYAAKAEYQEQNTGKGETQLQMLKRLLLTYAEFTELEAYCKSAGIAFLSTPFDLDSIAFLEQFDMPFWKIPSGEVTNLPYLIRIARTGKPAVLSTGMCTLDEVRAAVEALEGNGAGPVTLLHCNTQYPTPYEDVNLLAMEQLRREFHLEVGYSDHSEGIEVPVAAAALGAVIVEKHFTLDRRMEGPDHKASLEPDELKRMTEAVRHIELALGNGVKAVSPSERNNMTAARKSIVAARAIRRGELLTEENLTAKRPGGGVSPMRWFEALGTRALRDFEEDEQIEL